MSDLPHCFTPEQMTALTEDVVRLVRARVKAAGGDETHATSAILGIAAFAGCGFLMRRGRVTADAAFNIGALIAAQIIRQCELQKLALAAEQPRGNS